MAVFPHSSGGGKASNAETQIAKKWTLEKDLKTVGSEPRRRRPKES
jgi:hypothetical protein